MTPENSHGREAGSNHKSKHMIKFRLIFGKWLKIEGGELKGRDLISVLAFLAFILALILALLTRIDLPKIEVLF